MTRERWLWLMDQIRAYAHGLPGREVSPIGRILFEAAQEMENMAKQDEAMERDALDLMSRSQTGSLPYRVAEYALGKTRGEGKPEWLGDGVTLEMIDVAVQEASSFVAEHGTVASMGPKLRHMLARIYRAMEKAK